MFIPFHKSSQANQYIPHVGLEQAFSSVKFVNWIWPNSTEKNAVYIRSEHLHKPLILWNNFPDHCWRNLTVQVFYTQLHEV